MCYYLGMNIDKLVNVGLSIQQAEMYNLLIIEGSLPPPVAAKKLNLTRSNSYKLLDKLVELGLAIKQLSKNKTVYIPSNPINLTKLVMEARNKVSSQENAVNEIINELTEKYFATVEQPTVEIETGKNEVIRSYQQQIREGKSIYFIRSVADITSLGFEAMNSIRYEPSLNGQRRYGITPFTSDKNLNINGDKRTNLTRTWVERNDYSAPVEWSASGNSLLIVLFGEEPHSITINNPAVANAFIDLWKLIDKGLKTNKLNN